jgi:hypothetical protein
MLSIAVVLLVHHYCVSWLEVTKVSIYIIVQHFSYQSNLLKHSEYSSKCREFGDTVAAVGFSTPSTYRFSMSDSHLNNIEPIHVQRHRSPRKFKSF